MESHVLHRREVVRKLPIANASVYRWTQRGGGFPVRLGPRAVGWTWMPWSVAQRPQLGHPVEQPAYANAGDASGLSRDAATQVAARGPFFIVTLAEWSRADLPAPRRTTTASARPPMMRADSEGSALLPTRFFPADTERVAGLFFPRPRRLRQSRCLSSQQERSFDLPWWGNRVTRHA